MKTITRTRFSGVTLLIVTALLALAGLAQAQLKVSMMPSFTQNRAYANATLNQPIAVWGRAWGGTAPYSYVLSFGDGTPDATGSGLSESVASDEIAANHAYTLGGSKTVTLTVTDSTGAVAARSAVIRVIANPTHEEKVNMAIEKGLLYLYRVRRFSGNTRVYWQDTGSGGMGSCGGSLLAFGENGHQASNDYVEDIYAEMMQKGVNWITSRCRSRGLGNQASGNPDSNGNGRRIDLYDYAYGDAFAALGVNIAFPDAATAKATVIPAGERGGFTTPVAPSTEVNYYDFIAEMLDHFAYVQQDGGWKGWGYNNNSHIDGSTHQWPNMALLLARDRWGFEVVTPSPANASAGAGKVPQWVVDNSVSAFNQLTTNGGFYDGACGYASVNQWKSSGKTGGKLVGYHVGGKGLGDTDVDRAIGYLGRNWYHQRNVPISDRSNWPGNFYDMYAIKKGLSLVGAETVTTSDGVVHDWYQNMCSWLLGDASGVPASLAPGYRNRDQYAFGQRPDGSWITSVGWASWRTNYALTTSHAILVLTQAITIPLPVAIVEPVSVQPRNFAFGMDGSNSFHQSGDLDIVLYEWDWDASDGLSWESGPADASGSSTPTNPGYALPGFYTVTLRVTDNNPDEAQTDTATTVVEVTDQNAPPVAVPIPAGQPSYSGRIGDDITLDGSESFDPEGDPIILYDWDLDGDGVFGDAFGPNPVISFAAEYSGVIGLRVTSEDPDGVQKTSTNNTVIDIIASPSDLFVSAISADIIVSGEEANVSATVNNAADSGKPFTGVVVRFYNGNPFLGGSLVGPAILVDLPIGGSASIGPVNLTGLGGAEAVFVYVDANEAIGEYDENNNTASVNVANNPPIAVAQNVTVTADADCFGIVSAADIDGGSSDPDGDDITISVDPAGPYLLGDTEVTLTVSDGKASDTATAIVTVVDETPPEVTCPDPIIVNNDPGMCGAIVDYVVEAGDNCGTIFRFCDPVSGSFFDVGTTTVFYSVTDDAGNVSECEFTVTVLDNEDPVITCPDDIVVNNDPGECGAVVSYDIPVGTDNCPDPVTGRTGGLGSGAFFPVGTTTETYVVTDGAGNTATCSFTVTVNDNEAPTVVSCPADEIIECPADPAFGTPVFADNCGVVSVTDSDEVLAVSGKEVTKTKRTWTATDAAGHSISCSQVITSQDTTDPVIECPADVCIVSDAGSCDATNVDIGFPVVSDTCDSAPVVTNDHASSTYPLGDTVVTWTVTDHKGNSASCTQTITVLASVAGTWRSPLAGQPVANKIRVGQVVPHKIDLADCTGVAMTDLSGITVTLQIVGVNAVTGDIFQEVVEDAQGVGVDGTLTSDGLMEFKDDHWHFNVDTGNFDDPDTAGSDNHYISTVTITDNATLKILGTSSVTLETAARGGGKKK